MFPAIDSQLRKAVYMHYAPILFARVKKKLVGRVRNVESKEHQMGAIVLLSCIVKNAR